MGDRGKILTRLVALATLSRSAGGDQGKLFLRDQRIIDTNITPSRLARI
jgi:hypothetical protein